MIAHRRLKFLADFFCKSSPIGLLAVASTLIAQTASPSELRPTSYSTIQAKDYCNFLNQEAGTDEQNFYDEKMGSDAETACIAREGSPGCYEYVVIENRENFPVTYLSEKNVEAFIAWLDNSQLTENHDFMNLDEEGFYFIGSNALGYSITIAPESSPIFLSASTTQSYQSIFNYTPGATAKQRLLEAIGLDCGFIAGLWLGAKIVLALLPEASCGIFFPAIIITGIATAYLGEKLGKWLGS